MKSCSNHLPRHRLKSCSNHLPETPVEVLFESPAKTPVETLPASPSPRVSPSPTTVHPSPTTVHRSPFTVHPSPSPRVSPSSPTRRFLTYQSILYLYLLAIILAEALTTLFIPSVGVICHAVVLAALFIHSAATRSRTYRRILITLALAPLIRIISLSLPLQDYAFSYWYLLVGAPIFLSAYLVARYCAFRPVDIGLTLAGWPVQILFGLSGIALGYVEYLILHPEPLSTAFTLDQVWQPALILFIFTGLLEEIIFRGLMQKAFVDGLGKVRGIFYISILFAVLHLGYLSLLDLFFVFGVALLFGIVALRTRSILGVTLAHGLTNIVLFLVAPFFFS